MAYVMLWHKDPSAQNRTGLIKQTIFTTHGRTSLAFPDTPQNTTFFVAHMWDQPREVLRRLTRAGHAETCRSAEAGGLPFAFHRGWMVPEVIKGVNELLAEQEKLPKWGMPERVPRADEDEDEVRRRAAVVLSCRVVPDVVPVLCPMLRRRHGGETGRGSVRALIARRFSASPSAQADGDDDEEDPTDPSLVGAPTHRPPPAPHPASAALPPPCVSAPPAR